MTTPLPNGTRVRFLASKLIASERDDLSRCVEETPDVEPGWLGDEGIVAFPHPNQDKCHGFVFVAWLTTHPTTHEKRTLYVGCGPKQIAAVEPAITLPRPSETTAAEELRIIVANIGYMRESFLDRFDVEQIIQLYRAMLASGWDIYPDVWEERQVQDALRGIVPCWDDDERPRYPADEAKPITDAVAQALTIAESSSDGTVYAGSNVRSGVRRHASASALRSACAAGLVVRMSEHSAARYRITTAGRASLAAYKAKAKEKAT